MRINGRMKVEPPYNATGARSPQKKYHKEAAECISSEGKGTKLRGEGRVGGTGIRGCLMA